jgi:hypothetical protein
MYQSRNPFGYDESVLESDEDFEPYGFNSPRLAEVAWSPERALRRRDFSRVVEAAALNGIE